MKNVIKAAVAIIIAVILIRIFLINKLLPKETQTAEKQQITSTQKEFRGLWIATVYGLDYPEKPTTDSAQLKSEAVEILDFAKENGYNAVIFQARPCADSFFKSEYFPWSRFLTGVQGAAPNDNFDPLQFWTDEAHKRGIELHVWINPYRVTKKDVSDKDFDYSQLAANHPANLHKDWTVKYSDGNIYFNPGLPEVQRLIIDSVGEIVEKYEVDGIHFDDYFYPGNNFDDNDTYKKYGGDYENIGDFRRTSVDTLIKGVYERIKSIDKDCSFGISPFGIWANQSSNPFGSDTKGTQSYYDHFADTRKWAKEGWVDYIAPQLYWNIGNDAADYKTLLKWWKSVTQDTEVKLYIGQAAYLANNADENSQWYGYDEILRQLSLNDEFNADGSIFFRYKFLKKSESLATAVSSFYAEKDAKIVAAVD